MTASCRSCGTTFARQHKWQRLCWPCWRADRDRKREDDVWSAGYRAGLAAAYGQTPTPAPALDVGVLRQAAALCHPDRHPPERAEQANRVTAALLELYQERRAS